MTRHTMVRLGIAAAVALGLALWAGNSRQPQQQAEVAEPLVPGLRDALNDVRSVAISGAGNMAIATLERGDKGWTVREKHGYAADVAKVREFLLKLGDATLIEAKTTNSELYPKLGVEDVSLKDAKSGQVEIAGLKQPVRVVIGQANARGDGTYVRRAGEPQSWLAKGNLTLDKVGANWLQRDLADIASTRIASVEIAKGGKTLRVSKPEPTVPNYAVADVPRGRTLSSEFVANGLASVPAGLRFDDVLPAAEAQPDAASTLVATYVAFDGLVLTARAWQAGGKDLAQFDATLDEARAIAHVEAEQARAKIEHEAAKAAAGSAAPGPEGARPAAPAAPPAVADAAADREQRLAALRKEAAALDARFEGWTFVLPAYKFANINKSMDDMLAPLDAKPAAGQSEG